MIIAIIGDIHSNLTNLKKALLLVQEREVKHIIVVGDLQSLETIDIMGLTNIKSSIIFGNADWDRDAFLDKAKKYKNIKIFGDVGELKFDDVKIAFCHYPQTAKKLARENDTDVIFCGHWHSPWEEKINGTLIIRPGEVAGHFYKPTFCIFDTETMKAELVFINQ
ncbi:hypothetical protein COY62_03750 [bacterium (Candidatus Howlettbacteria) CG_4_10_14_0_8_um_filter_40_9]|nr:MAG: hypothetical protein COY62_03750 [bacterium (Candidatus Howlettbacteria) CG_4_10_14_0_8_um_filter_40_9]